MSSTRKKIEEMVPLHKRTTFTSDAQLYADHNTHELADAAKEAADRVAGMVVRMHPGGGGPTRIRAKLIQALKLLTDVAEDID